MSVRVVDLGDRERERVEDVSGRWRVIQGGAQAPEADRRKGGQPIAASSVAGSRNVAAPVSDELGERGPVHEAALRLFNFVVAAVGLVLTAPLFLLIAAAIKLDGGGPIFYRQIRVGVDRRRGRDGRSPDGARRTGDLGGKPFVLYKFRTMEVDAEDESGPSWSENGDHRVTRVGRLLRRHRLDELPQLWNVLKGEMAVVGPRPERPVFFQRLRQVFDAYPKRQTVPPGITGWAQVNRDSDTCLGDVEHKLRYDLQYLQRRSLWFDAYIMLKTPLVMLQREALAGNGGSSRDDDRALGLEGEQ